MQQYRKNLLCVALGVSVVWGVFYGLSWKYQLFGLLLVAQFIFCINGVAFLIGITNPNLTNWLGAIALFLVAVGVFLVGGILSYFAVSGGLFAKQLSASNGGVIYYLAMGIFVLLPIGCLLFCGEYIRSCWRAKKVQPPSCKE
ncbi:MAG: hypothetical protein FWD76_00190 [Firmicutes bacterium]|nr:hypothetical protein [Bacillota bacterium]